MTTLTITEAAILSHLYKYPSADKKLLVARLGPAAQRIAKTIKMTRDK
jgi:hypothetical protein